MVNLALFNEYVHGYATKYNIKMFDPSDSGDPPKLGEREPPTTKNDM